MPRGVSAGRWRLVPIAAIGVGAALLGLQLVLPALAHDRVAAALAESGFPGASFRVRSVDLGGVRIADLELAPDLAIAEVNAELDLLEGRVDTLTLTDARWSVAPSAQAVRTSSIARLIDRGRRDPSGPAPPRIRLVRARIEVARAGGAPRIVTAEGEIDPAAGDAALDVRSELGVYAIVLSSEREGELTRVHAQARSEGDRALADARIELGPRSTSVRLSARADGLRAPSLAIDRARVEGWVRIDEGSIRELELRARSEGARAGPLALESAALDATLEGAAIALRAAARSKDGLVAHAGGALPRELGALVRGAPLAWGLAGPLPGSLVSFAAPGVELRGDPRVRASGRVRRTREGWAIDAIDAQIEIRAFDAPGVGTRLEEVRLELRGRARIGDRVELAVAPGSRLRAERAQIEDLHMSGLDLAPVLRLSAGERGSRIELERDVDAHMRSMAIGTGASALRFDGVELVLASRGSAPIVELVRSSGRVGFDMRASAERVRGILLGGRTLARAALDVELLPDETRIDLPLDLRTSRLREPNSEVSLADARVRLPLRWRADVFGADGDIAAREMSFRGTPIGRGAGTLRLSSDSVALTWRGPATASTSFDARARIALGDEAHGSVRIVVPQSVAGPRDPFTRVLAALTRVRVEGPVEGELDLDVAAPERGDAWIRVQGASVEELDGSGRARDVHGMLRFTSLAPLVSAAAPDPGVLWGALELGDLVTTGPGSASLRFERSGELAVSAFSAAAAGGRVELAPFRFDPDAPDLALHLTVRDIELSRLARALTGGRIAATGRLDGHVALRVQLGEGTRRVLLGDGRFAARGPGDLRIGDGQLDPAEEAELAGMIDGGWIERRVLDALADFEYREIALTLDDPAGTRRLSARVLGRGKRTTQELDLRLHVRGVQPLLDHALRLWPTAAADAITRVRHP